jgi:hypothetical protein
VCRSGFAGASITAAQVTGQGNQQFSDGEAMVKRGIFVMIDSSGPDARRREREAEESLEKDQIRSDADAC